MVDSIETNHAREHFDVDHAFIAHLNGECHEWSGMDSAALLRTLQAQGESWGQLVREHCPHLFAAAPVFISELQLQQMQAVVAAVEEVVGKPEPDTAHGVFYGYDFHLNENGTHLIEINTNAGGAFLNALLVGSQRDFALYGAGVSGDDLESVFVEMFRNEWHLAHADAVLKTIAIVDEQPETQYLYPEFLLAKKMMERAGIVVHIAAPNALEARSDGLYCDGEKIDLVYNRLTDFELKRHLHIRSAWERKQVVLTPNPAHYLHYADKRNLVLLSDIKALQARGVSQAGIDALAQGVPLTRLVHAVDTEQWWAERKQWFFKPVDGYGSKGAYRGEKLTKRVFEEIMNADYVAQRLALPGERMVCVPGAEPQSLKYDVRCYVYDGNIQLIAARLYQGQTTNFRTPGGGFALVRAVS